MNDIDLGGLGDPSLELELVGVEDPERPPELTAFGDDGRPIAVTHPIVTDGDPEVEQAEDTRADTREILAGLLRLVCDADASALVIGQRALVIGYLSGAVLAGSDAELADRIGISASRLSHIKRTIPKQLTSLLRLKRRQAQGRATGKSTPERRAEPKDDL